MKRFLSIAIVFSAIFSLHCAPKSVKIGVMTGTSGYSCLHLIENKATVPVKNLGFEVYNSYQAEISRLLTGQLDIGFTTPLQAARINAKDKNKIVVLGVTQESDLKLVTTDPDYSSIFSLKDKKILATGQNQEPEALFQLLLKKNEISAEIDFDTSAPEIASALISKKADYALLEEPYASQVVEKSLGQVQCIEISNLLERSTPSIVMVVNAKFAKSNGDTIFKISEAYKKSLEWVQRNPVRTGALAEKYKLTTNQKIAEKAIPHANYSWKSADTCKGDIENLLKIIQEQTPEAFKGKMPSDNFYFLEK